MPTQIPTGRADTDADETSAADAFMIIFGGGSDPPELPLELPLPSRSAASKPSNPYARASARASPPTAPLSNSYARNNNIPAVLPHNDALPPPTVPSSSHRPISLSISSSASFAAIFGGNQGNSSTSASSASLRSNYRISAPTTPFSLKPVPSHTPFPTCLLNLDASPTIALITAVSGSKTTKSNKAYKQLTLSYPGLFKPSALRMFNQAYNSASSLKPGLILLLQEYRIDKDKSSIMAFMSDSVSVLGTERRLKWCKCGYSGAVPCSKCNKQHDGKSVAVNGNAFKGKKLADGFGKFSQFRAPTSSNATMRLQRAPQRAPLQLVKPNVLAPKRDLLGAAINKNKRKFSQIVPSSSSRSQKPAWSEDIRYDGSVRVPQAKTPSFTSRPAVFEPKRKDERVILERQRQAKRMIEESLLNNASRGPITLKSRPVAQAGKQGSSGDDFAKTFGAVDHDMVKKSKSMHDEQATDLVRLRGMQKVDGLERREEVEAKKQKKKGNRRVVTMFECLTCGNVNKIVPEDCRMQGHDVRKRKDLRDKDGKKGGGSDSGLIVGVGVDFNGHSVARPSAATFF